MMKLTVLCVGKIKESFFTAGIKEYEKRLSRYCKLTISEVSDEKTPEKASNMEELLIKEREGKRLFKHINEGDYVIALAIEGEKLNSEQFSQKLSQLGINGVSRIVFVIGGSLGLNKQILNRADMLLSFSDMTFPHQMMRLILLEQVYRGYRIMKGEPYHK